jgi:hypothetical protein
MFLVLVGLGALLLSSCDDDLIQVPNNPPVLEMGAPREVTRGFSYLIAPARVGDFDGDALDYHWSLIQRPATSAAVLEDSTTATPTLVPDVLGDYAIDLELSDGRATVADTLQLTAVAEVVAATWTDVQSAMLTVTNTAGDDCGNCHSITYAWASSWVSLTNPPGSTLLSKPTSGSNSGHSYAGRGWSPGEDTYELVLDWIEHGAPQN